MNGGRLAAFLVLVAGVSYGAAQARVGWPADAERFALDLRDDAVAYPPLNGFSGDRGDAHVAAVGALAYPAELLPGKYGRIVVEPGAEIVLGSGQYTFESLSLGADAVVWLDPYDADEDDLVDAVEVRVLRKLEVGSGAELTLVDPELATTRDIEITVLHGGHVTIPADAVVRGTLLAPNAKVTFREGSRLEGAVYAHRVRVDPGVMVEYHPRPEGD